MPCLDGGPVENYSKRLDEYAQMLCEQCQIIEDCNEI